MSIQQRKPNTNQDIIPYDQNAPAQAKQCTQYTKAKSIINGCPQERSKKKSTNTKAACPQPNDDKRRQLKNHERKWHTTAKEKTTPHKNTPVKWHSDNWTIFLLWAFSRHKDLSIVHKYKEATQN
jgi:hypothetical protein